MSATRAMEPGDLPRERTTGARGLRGEAQAPELRADVIADLDLGRPLDLLWG